ncbi:MAG: alpha/beta hydrolase [Armatimonadota bacterium]
MNKNKQVQRVLGRRSFLAATALIGTGLVIGSFSGAASAAPLEISAPSDKASVSAASIKSVTFKNGALKMAGNLYLPAGFDAAKKYATLVVVHPGGGVKEQAAGLYAKRLSEQGFVTLAFDASHQGASEGMPRFLDDPMKRVGDIYSAVDYLTTLPYVDAGRIGALGVCAGSGHTIKATTTDRRIKAVATVSAVDVGASFRNGWDGKAPVSAQIATLEAAARQRTAEAAGAAPAYIAYVPNVGDRTAPLDLQEAADYYLTPRGQHPNAPNKMLLTSASYMISYTGFDRVDTLLTQPVLIIAGSKAGSLWHSQELHAKAASGSKKLVIIDGATHMDLYDGPGAELAVDKLAPFFKKNL